jgi:hypothetical protein
METNGNSALVEALLAVAAEIFDEHFIISPVVRKEVIEMLIRSGRFVELLSQKDDILSYALDGVASDKRDPFEIKKSRVTIPMGLKPHERTAVATACPDVELQFLDGGYAPHGRAAAFRMIHQAQALSLVSHHLGTVLDIGGNYARYAKTAERRSYSVHACTKRVVEPEPEGELEWHRHAQRDVDLEVSDVVASNYCIIGAEHCRVPAVHGVCIHALYDIDPELWVDIFRNHGLEYVVCYFHYDVAMEVDDVGYMPGPGMHWARTGDNEIQCHFEDDSSHPYTHRRDWLVRYGSTWTMTHPDWDYVLYYEVEFIDAGNAKSSFTRMQKNTLGHSDAIAQFRYIDIEDSVELMVPKFNPDLGKSVNDPRGYEMTYMRVSMALFSHVLRFGISNDTERSDLPLTFDAVKDQCHTFNHVRKVGGTTITVPYRLGQDAIADAARGMYLVIVKRAAMNKVKYMAYTDNMRTLQRRWGDENVFFMAGKAFAYAAIAPFMLMAQSIDEVASLLVASMRRQVTEDLVVMHAEDVVPYRFMRPIQMVGGTFEAQMSGSEYVPPTEDERFDRPVEPSRFYSVFKDTMEPEHRRRVEEYLKEHGVKADDKSLPKESELEDTSATPDPVVVQDPDFDQEAAPATTGDVDNRDDWEREYLRLQDELDLVTLPPRDPKKYTFEQRTAPEKVWMFAREALREYQLYNVDVALNVLLHSKERCRETWGSGRPRDSDVLALNIQLDLGIVYFDVRDGKIEGMSADTKYAMVIDPVTQKHLQPYAKGGVCYVGGAVAPKVFTCEALRIFNMFAIASRARKVLNTTWTIKVEAILIDGVPGCGKTYTIMQNFNVRDVIMTMVRETRDATYDELCADERFDGYKDVLKQRVRTSDSAAMHGLPLAQTLHVDEGLMGHMGNFVLGVRSCKPKKMVVYGDSTQIGFIDRGSKLGNLHFMSLFYWTQIIENNESFRCPADAMWVSSQFYPAERRPRIKTMSPRLRSLSYILEPDVKGQIWTDSAKPWITVSILRGDMDELITRNTSVFCKGTTTQKTDPRVPVFSVHEVQGRTKPFVRAVRISPFNPDVINSEPHLNVMFTRHTLKMVYISSCDESVDRASYFVKRAIRLSDDELRAMQLPTPEWLQKRMLKQEKKYAHMLM